MVARISVAVSHSPHLVSIINRRPSGDFFAKSWSKFTSKRWKKLQPYQREDIYKMLKSKEDGLQNQSHPASIAAIELPRTTDWIVTQPPATTSEERAAYQAANGSGPGGQGQPIVHGGYGGYQNVLGAQLGQDGWPAGQSGYAVHGGPGGYSGQGDQVNHAEYSHSQDHGYQNAQGAQLGQDGWPAGQSGYAVDGGPGGYGGQGDQVNHAQYPHSQDHGYQNAQGAQLGQDGWPAGHSGYAVHGRPGGYSGQGGQGDQAWADE
ncbi:hypothetical protein JCM3770_001082 [Rhodotorula araucariae]